MGHLLFCIGAVRFIYEVRLSSNGLGWSAIFQSPRADSGGPSKIVLLRNNRTTVPLSHGSVPLLLLSRPIGLSSSAGWACPSIAFSRFGLDPSCDRRRICGCTRGATASDASPNPLLIRDVPGNDSGAFTSVLGNFNQEIKI